MKRLPTWNINNLQPAFCDLESATVLDMTKKLYKTMQDLIDEYNTFVNDINANIEAFESSTNKDYECFKNYITKTMHDYIAMLDEKIKSQDKEIAQAVAYMKTNIYDTTTEVVHQIMQDENIILPYINVKEFGAVGDGVTDDTQAIQEAINLHSNIVIPDGVYLVDKLDVNKSIIITGSQNTVLKMKDSNSNTSILRIVGTNSENVEISNLTLDGNKKDVFGCFAQYLNSITVKNSVIKNCGNVGYSQGHTKSIDGIMLSKCKNGYISNCIFDTIERDGLLGYPCENLTVKDCTFENCGRFPSANTHSDGGIGGIEIVGPKQTKYVHNTANNCGCGGFDVETAPALDPVYALFDGNSIIDCGNDDWGYSWGITMGGQSYGEVINNRIENLGMNSNIGNAIVVGTTKGDVVIKANIINGCKLNGVYIETTGNDVIICDNQISKAGQNGVFISNNTHCSILNNIIKKCGMHGIRLLLASACRVIGNSIKNNSQSANNTYSAIKSEQSFNLNICENNISGTEQKYGFELDNHSYKSQINFVSNVIAQMGTHWFNFAGTNTTKGDIKSGICEFISSSVWGVTDGTWNVGDKVLIQDYTNNGFLGWVCTTAGTHGTWKKFGEVVQHNG